MFQKPAAIGLPIPPIHCRSSHRRAACLMVSPSSEDYSMRARSPVPDSLSNVASLSRTKDRQVSELTEVAKASNPRKEGGEEMIFTRSACGPSTGAEDRRFQACR